jgi:hypothetical protein
MSAVGAFLERESELLANARTTALIPGVMWSGNGRLLSPNARATLTE